MRRALALLSLLLAGCSTRERLNPLDPQNAATGGRPPSFAALAENAQVFLTWSAGSSTQPLEYQLFRQAEGEADYQPLTAILPQSVSSYLDLGLVNGVTYRYRLYFVVGGQLSGAPSEDIATPSTVIPWVADDQTLSLYRMSADGRQPATQATGFAGPTDCRVDPISHVVWVADEGGGRVVVFNPGLGSGLSIRGLGDPTYLAVDAVRGTAWVSTVFGGEVFQLQPDGSFGTPASISPLQAPAGIDVDPADQSLWVCERRSNTVRHFDSLGNLLHATAVSAPLRVAVDTSNGEAWVSCFDTRQVVHLAASGAPVDTVSGFQGPLGIAVDEARGRIWVADPVAGQVVALRRNGSVEFRVSGLPGASALAVEDVSGEAWAVMTGTIARVSGTGATILFAKGLRDPVAITLDRFAP